MAIRLFQSCVALADRLTTFTSSQAELPATTMSVPPTEYTSGCGFPCYQPEWCLADIHESEGAASPRWNLTFRYPKALKPGLWDIHVALERGSLGPIPADPDYLTNRYDLFTQYRCDPGCFYVLPPIGFCGGPVTASQGLGTVDGSDAVASSSMDISDFPVYDPSQAPCCFTGNSVMHFHAGAPSSSDLTSEYQIWSWKLTVSGVWASDFP